MLRNRVLSLVVLLVMLGLPAYSQVELVPRFLGEMSVFCKDLELSHSGEGAKFSGRYQWWDHCLKYELTTGQNGGAAQGVLRAKLPEMDISGYDQLVVSFSPFWVGQEMTVAATVDGKRLQQKTIPAKRNTRAWITIPFKGGKRLQGLEFIVSASRSGQYAGMIETVVLRNSAQFEMMKKHWQRFADVNWDAYLKPANYQPTFKVKRGLFYSDSDIEALRSMLAANTDLKYKFLYSPKRDMVVDWSKYVYPVLPCLAQEEHMPQQSYYMHQAGPRMAFAGLVAKDPKMMREAAKLALYLASYGNWDEQAIPMNTPGHWYEAAFRASFVADGVAKILDYAGEMLTTDGYKYVLRSLYRKGVAEITYSLYSRPMFDSNQYVYFNSGRVLATLMMEQEWPEIKAATDDYVGQMKRSVDLLFRPDGSFKESTGYLDVVLPHTLRTYYVYARARGLALKDVVPENLLKSSRYAQLLRMGNPQMPAMLVPIGDSHGGGIFPESAGLMALVCPGTDWETIYQGNPVPESDIRNWYLYNVLKSRPPVKPKRIPFIFLADTGLAASQRYQRECLSRLVVVGNKERGKIVGDIGSFSLEYGGELFAVPMPNVRWGVYTNCTFYNTLVPKMKDGSYPETGQGDIEMSAEGDAKSCRVRMDLKGILDKSALSEWTREITSPTPDRFVINDHYRCKDTADGAELLWISQYPVSVEDDKVTIRGKQSVCTLIVPTGCKVRTEMFIREQGGAVALGLAKDHKFTRIRIHNPKPVGEISLAVELKHLVQ